MLHDLHKRKKKSWRFGWCGSLRDLGQDFSVDAVLVLLLISQEEGLRTLVPPSTGKNSAICPTYSVVVRIANGREAMKGFGKYKKCSTAVSARSSRRLFIFQTIQRKFFLDICPLIPFFPIFPICQ